MKTIDNEGQLLKKGDTVAYYWRDGVTFGIISKIESGVNHSLFVGSNRLTITPLFLYNGELVDVEDLRVRDVIRMSHQVLGLK